MPTPEAVPHPLGRGWMRPHRRQLATTLGTVVAGVIGFSVTPLVGAGSRLGAIVALAAVALIVPLTIRRVRAVATSDHPVLDAVQAVVLLLTVLVFGFAGLFVVLDHRGDQFAGLDTKIDAVYFTVTTLSTVGYGDVHAVGQAGRVAVTLQIVFNMAFLAVALRLVVHAAQSRLAQAPAPWSRPTTPPGPAGGRVSDTVSDGGRPGATPPTGGNG